MGFKRPFDDVEFQELPYKHSRQHEFGDRCSPFFDAVSCYGAPRKTYVSGNVVLALHYFHVPFVANIACFLTY